MVVPCGCELRRPAESTQPAERRRMLHIDCPALSQAAADVCCRSGYQIFDRDYGELARVAIQRRSARQRASELEKQVDTNGAWLIDQLQQHPSVGGIRVNVVLEK